MTTEQIQVLFMSLVGIAVFTIPSTIKLIKWYNKRRSTAVAQYKEASHGRQ